MLNVGISGAFSDVGGQLRRLPLQLHTSVNLRKAQSLQNLQRVCSDPLQDPSGCAIPEVLKILHPFKPADSNATPTGIDVRAHNNALLPENRISSRSRRAVCCLHHKLAVELSGHSLIDCVGAGSRNEDIARHAEHLIV